MRLTSDSVGRRLAAIRTDRGLTQAALAAAIGKSRQCVCHWERGSSDLRMSDLHRLAEALDCRLRDLLAPPEAPIPSLHPRRKRRRSVSHLDEAPAPRIQDWLGHRSIQHTTRYTQLSAAPFKDFWR
jgi:transcriptional regulator with XRE-family HTH domain